MINRSFLALVLSILVSGWASASESVDFALPDLEGKTHKLSDYRGKWVIVNYWATWCPPCLDEIPDLVDFHDRHKARDAVVIGVNFEEIATDTLTEFVDHMFISYPVLRMEPRPRTELGMVNGLPTTYIVSPEGKLVAYQEGPITAEQLDAFLHRKMQQRADGQK